jgi:hypothetical protein
VTVNVPGVVPLAGVTISQLESLVAVKLSAPPVPVFVTFTIAGAGSFAMPNNAEKVSVVIETVSSSLPPVLPPPPHAASAAQSIVTHTIPAARFKSTPLSALKDSR